MDGDCKLRRWPSAPAHVNDDGVDVGPRWYVLKDVLLDQRNDVWKTVGFDIDGRCTRDRDPNARTTCASSNGQLPPGDGEGGIDNVLGQAGLDLALASQPDMQAEVHASFNTGASVPVYRITRWNGQANDPAIRLAVTQAVFTVPSDVSVPEPPPATSPLYTSDWPFAAPRWDGYDKVYVRSDSFVQGDLNQPVEEYDAYVKDYTFVVRTRDRAVFSPVAPGFNLEVLWLDKTIVGSMPRPGEGAGSVVFQGRWRVTDMVDSMGRSGFWCKEDQNLGFIRDVLTKLADVRADPETENQGLTCDAISSAVRFANYAVEFGGVTTKPGDLDLCATQSASGAALSTSHRRDLTASP
jgi:hypothetical protein